MTLPDAALYVVLEEESCLPEIGKIWSKRKSQTIDRMGEQSAQFEFAPYLIRLIPAHREGHGERMFAASCRKKCGDGRERNDAKYRIRAGRVFGSAFTPFRGTRIVVGDRNATSFLR